MRKALRTISIASLLLGGLAAASPLYAHKQSKPSTGQDMMQGGGMDGMMGMMTMMELCNKMMASKMDGTGSPAMNMPMDAPAAPEKKN
jgi:hypothetical protein